MLSVSRGIERFDARFLNSLTKRQKSELDHRHFGLGRRLKNPTLKGVEEAINQPLFDSFSVAANTGFPKTTLFQTPQGSGGKTAAQTNMSQAGVLPNPQRLIIKALRIFVSNDTVPADLNLILRNVSFVFFVGKKPMFEGFVGLLSAGCGAVVTAAAQVGTAPAGSAPLFSTSNGIPDQRNVYSLTRDIVVEQGEAISAVFNPETAFNTAAAGANPAGVGTTIYVVLDGELYRGVQ